MKKRILCLVLATLLCLTAVIALCACDNDGKTTDYVAETTLKRNSARATMEVTVRMYIDGDTTHFYVPDGMSHTMFPEGVLKARYLSVDTPESTGAIEEWGKQASNFTKEKLEKATSIILESDNNNWNTDSTGGRYLVWVWYQPEEGAEYRLLNLELLQNGLAKINNAESGTYNKVCEKAVEQAQDQKLRLFGEEKDPLFFYQDAIEVSIKQLRLNIADYEQKKVGFDGIITYKDEDSLAVYVQEYNPEDDMYYGMYVYYGYDLKSGFQKLIPGNKIHFVGKVTNFNGNWQVSDIFYAPFPSGDDAKKTFTVVDTGCDVVYDELTAAKFNSTKSILVNEDATTPTEFKYAELILGTAVSFSNLTVNNVRDSISEDTGEVTGSTLECTDANGGTVQIRIDVLHEGDKASNPIIPASTFLNKTINVKGHVEYFKWTTMAEGIYQIQVNSVNHIQIVE